MRLLFLCKRQPQQRDLLERPYGRYFHLPAGLAARGHEVAVALLSHRRLPSERRERAGVTWYADDLLPDPRAYGRRIRALAREFRPDWIVGASDTYYGILAARLARRCGARCAIDAYDNVESYLPWAWPLHAAWRGALGQAHLITAPGPQLLARLRSHAPAAAGAVVPMAADALFKPGNRQDARRRLGLPEDARLIGYCGSLHRTRGVGTLLDAFARVQRQDPAVLLVASGRVAVALPAAVRHVGYLADEAVPAFLNALDVACVTTAPGAFGDFAYPAKLYEALACGVPVVATDVPPIRWILAERAPQLAPPGDAAALAARLAEQLARPLIAPAPAGWDAAVDRLELALR